MPALQFFDFIVFGELHTEFIIDLHQKSREAIMGGSALYAAGGLRNWSERIGIVARTDLQNQPELKMIRKKYQIDIEGISYRNPDRENRQFYAYLSPTEMITKNPVAYYASRKLIFPRALIGFTGLPTQTTPPPIPEYMPGDIPKRYQNTAAAILCQAKLITHLQISSMLLNQTTTSLLIISDPIYMKMENFEILSTLLKDVSAFVTTLPEMYKLFQNRTRDLWEMADAVCTWGCETVAIHDGKYGFFLYCRNARQRCHAPMYPVEVIDPTGTMESFSGGFLAGLKMMYDPREALAHGIVSASLTLEGSGPFFGMDSLQGLRDQRLRFTREMVKRV